MKLKRIAFILMLLIGFSSCKNFFSAFWAPVPKNTNTQQLLVQAIKNELYDSAQIYVGQNKGHLLPKSEMLRQVELGRLLFLSGKYHEANKLFIAAEYKIEDKRNFRYVDAFAGTAEIYNPFHPAYIGNSVNDLNNFGPRPFTKQDSIRLLSSTSGFPPINALYSEYICNNMEKPLVNFYTGLGSVYQNSELLIVEAKRLGLLAEQLDQYKASSSLNLPYTPNPFLKTVAGLFYEAGGSLNDALISYENAYNDFENKNCIEYYGTKTPKQLKSDILSINKKMGFYDKESVWKRKMNEQNKSENYTPSLILFIEEGIVNHKIDQPNLPKMETLNATRVSSEPNPSYSRIKDNSVTNQINQSKLSQNQPQTVVSNKPFPAYMSSYVLSPIYYSPPINTVSVNNTPYTVYKIMDLSYQMEHAYGKRYYYELMGHGSANNADYRQWLSLPSRISYVKIPLVAGQTNYTVRLVAKGKAVGKTITVENVMKSQIRYLYLPKL